MKHFLLNDAGILALALALAPCAGLGGPAQKPILYNDMAGDGNAGIDRSIRQAFGADYTIVDTGASAGYAGPETVAGSLPRIVRNKDGTIVEGYALIVYIVTDKGEVASPVIVKGADPGLCRVALDAMAGWKFKPATLRGRPVASTAAQEFNFGPDALGTGFKMDSVIEYQSNETLVRRMPPNARMWEYIRQVTEVAHHFFVGAARPETVSIVFLVEPGLHQRVWIVSSQSPEGAPELEPLRKLVMDLPPLSVHGGPVALCMTGVVAGGDGAQKAIGEFQKNPIPDDWARLAKTMVNPPPYPSDEFLEKLLPPTPGQQ